uniref:Glycosyltransferase C17G8.11c n=1 Tax=Caligus clemensi TaxID=344056 RepID=C1C0Q4_CALCM|nr:glycosyltransferase C17G8.11c [Caligus clemensi]
MRRNAFVLKLVFLVLCLVFLNGFRTSISYTQEVNTKISKPPNDLNGTLSNISQLHQILMKGSMREDLPIQGIQRLQEQSYDIPPLIHMMWIFKEIPQKYINNVLRVYEINKNYTLCLWLDSTSFKNSTLISFLTRKRLVVKNIEHIKWINAGIIGVAKAKKKIGMVPDILRFEVVYNMGGIYTDMDTIALKQFPLDIFSKSFVTHTTGGYNNLNVAVFGMPKESRFLKYVMDFIRIKSFPKYFPSVLSSTGPPAFTTVFVDYHDPRINCIPQEYLIAPRTPHSFSYHSMDGAWMRL